MKCVERCCAYCKDRRHNTKRCPSKPSSCQFCSICYFVGHAKKECPKRGDGSARINYCDHCKVKGHRIFECDQSQIDCQFCFLAGHVMKDCPLISTSPSIERQATMDSGLCK